MADTLHRTPLTRERILLAAVALADAAGIQALSMRNLAQDLGVVPMALYKHVANKDELLDGMIDVVVGEIDPPRDDLDWKRSVRLRILSARQMLLRHPWAPLAIESRNMATMAVLSYLDSVVATLR
ncbi:TetR/AcrR family transcriptional regulator, partial [Micromonospora orduensis]